MFLTDEQNDKIQGLDILEGKLTDLALLTGLLASNMPECGEDLKALHGLLLDNRGKVGQWREAVENAPQFVGVN